MPTSSIPPESSGQPALLRHIVPVVFGGLVTLMLTVVTDNMLGAHGVLPSPGHPVFETGPLLLAAAYRGLFAMAGCHLAARLAPAGHPRIRYALVLGGLMLVLNVVGASTLWGQVPMWYSLSGIALTVPYAIIGGGTAARVMAGAETAPASTQPPTP
jgi:hypothetical protein